MLCQTHTHTKDSNTHTIGFQHCSALSSGEKTSTITHMDVLTASNRICTITAAQITRKSALLIAHIHTGITEAGILGVTYGWRTGKWDFADCCARERDSDGSKLSRKWKKSAAFGFRATSLFRTRDTHVFQDDGVKQRSVCMHARISWVTVCSNASFPFVFSFYDFVFLFNWPLHLSRMVLLGIVCICHSMSGLISLCLLAHRGLNLVVNKIVLSDCVVY